MVLLWEGPGSHTHVTQTDKPSQPDETCGREGREEVEGRGPPFSVTERHAPKRGSVEVKVGDNATTGGGVEKPTTDSSGSPIHSHEVPWSQACSLRSCGRDELSTGRRPACTSAADDLRSGSAGPVVFAAATAGTAFVSTALTAGRSSWDAARCGSVASPSDRRPGAGDWGWTPAATERLPEPRTRPACQMAQPTR